MNSVLFNPKDQIPAETSRRIRSSNVSLIKEMMYLAEEEKKKGKEIISLGVGVPSHRMPDYIRRGIQKSLTEKQTIDQYTFFAGLPGLRQKIAMLDSQKLNLPVSEEEILITSGSMTALLYSALSLIDPGDEVLLIAPYFASYEQQILLAGGTIVEVPSLKPRTRDGKYHLDVELIEACITKKTKALILNSPQNPTGAVYAEAELRALVTILKRHDLYLITDEVYEYLLYDDTPYFNIASLAEIWPKVIRCCSFSKRFSMTGWRIGYLHTNKELLKWILKIHDNNIVCAPHPAQEAVLIALSEYDQSQEMAKNIQALTKNRETICARMDRLPGLFTYVKPQGAYYVFPEYSLDLPSTNMALRLLYETGVVTTPGIGFGRMGEHHLRLSFACTEEEIHAALDRIETWWKKQNTSKRLSQKRALPSSQESSKR